MWPFSKLTIMNIFSLCVSGTRAESSTTLGTKRTAAAAAAAGVAAGEPQPQGVQQLPPNLQQQLQTAVASTQEQQQLGNKAAAPAAGDARQGIKHPHPRQLLRAQQRLLGQSVNQNQTIRDLTTFQSMRLAWLTKVLTPSIRQPCNRTIPMTPHYLCVAFKLGSPDWEPWLIHVYPSP